MKPFHDYDISDFGNDGTLKISSLLWIVIAYLSRHYLVLVLGAISNMIASKRGFDMSGLATLYSSPLFLAASAPAVTVILINFLRVPESGNSVRKVWHWGRGLLVSAAIADLAVMTHYWYLGELAIGELVIGAFILDIYAILYLIRSARVRDTFADFPQPSPPEEESS